MSEFIANCPGCGKSFEFEPQFAGKSIKCPGCQNDLIAPNPQSAGKGGLKISATPAHSGAAPATPPASHPIHNFQAGQFHQASAGRSGKLKTIAIVAACAIGLPVGAYFGYQGVQQWRAEREAKEAEAKKQAEAAKAAEAAAAQAAAAQADPFAATASSTNEPPVPVTWTMDLDSVKIPSGRPRGELAGTNFTADRVLLDITSPLHVLTLRRGTNAVSDQEVLIYLRLKAGETIADYKRTVTSELQTGAPTVEKRWRPRRGAALQRKVFSSGYAMKVEFGKAKQGVIPGRVYLALPDEEQSFLAGAFNANIRVIQPAAAQSTTSTTQPPARPR